PARPNTRLQPAPSLPLLRIDSNQLFTEICCIHSHLFPLETKCIIEGLSVLPRMSKRDRMMRWSEQSDLRRQLLLVHCEFFMSSQHPQASPGARSIVSEFDMLGRMRRYGIQEFLSTLHAQLPESKDHLVSFLCFAIRIVELLYETVPAFRLFWMECLGDLYCHRSYVEDDRPMIDTWNRVAQSWFLMASAENPTEGRLYHRLAAVAGPNPLRQLYYYTKSGMSREPFPASRQSLWALLNQATSKEEPAFCHTFRRIHALILMGVPVVQLNDAILSFRHQLDQRLTQNAAEKEGHGEYISLVNIAGLFGYGLKGSGIDEIISSSQTPAEAAARAWDDTTFSKAYHVTMVTLEIFLSWPGNHNTLAHVHILLAFLYSSACDPCLSAIIDDAPWASVATFLNKLLKPEHVRLLNGALLPSCPEESERPLPEDYSMRGQRWSESYLPEKWFSKAHDMEERFMEYGSTPHSRKERILRIGHCLSAYKRWIIFCPGTGRFSVNNSGSSKIVH
ncbi:hypothetical protein B0J11DRAFT_447476, partial [Dendryphion nanum]